MNYILAPSLLAADFQCLAEQMKQTEENGAKYLHFDVMDGMFVPSISFGVPVLKSIKGATNQVMDVHSDGAGTNPLCKRLCTGRSRYHHRPPGSVF